MERIVFHVAVAFVTDSMRTFERSALSLSVFAERGEANRALLLGHAKMPPKQSIFFSAVTTNAELLHVDTVSI